MKINEIKQFIHHRYPFLLIDRVLKINEKKEILALKNVTVNEEFFNGHFPTKKIMPGVLIIESMAQAGTVLAMKSLPQEKRSQYVCYFISIEKFSFRIPVEPGDSLFLEVKKIFERHNIWHMQGVAKVNNVTVANGLFKAILKKINE